jgi:hypothetical protein
MAILIFPAIAPNYLKEISLPDYGMLSREFEDGGERRISAQFNGSDTGLILEYQLRTHTESATIIEFWALTKGTWLSFTLPSVIIQHPVNVVTAINLLSNTTYWRFEEGLSIKTDYATAQRGLYSFDVSLRAVVS